MGHQHHSGCSHREAADWYYKFSQDTNYIRRDCIARDMQWKAPTEYGDLDITINLSKPEKDPKAIAARLKEKLAAVADGLVSGSDLRACELTAKHADWAEGFAKKYAITREDALDIVQKETGLVFAQVLEHAEVYKRNPDGEMAFLKFLNCVRK